MQKYRRYDPTFRAEAVALITEARGISEVSRDLGMPMKTLWRWYNEDMAKRGKRKQVVLPAGAIPLDETPEQKIARLQREVAHLKKKNSELEMDRAILKKAAAFFAKESE
jgi:transposase